PEKVKYPDQDALNGTLVGKWIELPSCWNSQNWLHAEAAAAVVHFIGESKPWHWSNEHPFKREYHKYTLKTPWQRYKEEGRPDLPQRLGRSLLRLTRAVLPARLRKGIKSIYVVYLK